MAGVEEFFARLLVVLPRLRSQFGLVGLVVAIGGYAATQQVAPESLPARIAAAGVGVNIMVFGQVFHFLRLIPEGERAKLILRLFLIFCITTFGLLGLTGYLARLDSLELSAVSLYGVSGGRRTAANTLDDLEIAWSYDGRNRDVALSLVRSPGSSRVSAGVVSATDGRAAISASRLKELWPHPKLDDVYMLRVEFQGANRRYPFGPFEVKAGLLIWYYYDYDNGLVTVASTTDRSQLIDHAFESKCLAWGQGARSPEDVQSVTVRATDGKGRAVFSDGFVPDVSTLKCMYLGQYPIDLIRYSNLNID